MNKIEILAPAGGYDSLISAVRSGADAVYLGATEFSARSSAKNFTLDELKNAIEYCHIRDAKVYLTVNTLVTDDELGDAMDIVINSAKMGIDAVIVQDFGFARLIQKAIPDLPLHASTQMSVHTPAGAIALYNAGFKRCVLARELSREEILQIHSACPNIELEVFVHGALCMCMSGQCYFSSILGARSGNRGACAQPCRLPFAIKDNNGFALSLRDNSIIDKINDLYYIGVTSAKIEGRMKRPEYVASSVRACVEARDLGKISDNTLSNLSNVFSRTGFTDGYYTARRTKDMFGFRRKDDVVSANEKLFTQIRTTYKDELKRVPISISLDLKLGQKASLTISDGRNTVTVQSDDLLQKAINLPADEDFCEKQLSKTGGTPFYVDKFTCNIDSVCAISASALNLLRRNALEKLTTLRQTRTPYQINELDIPTKAKYNKRHLNFDRRLRLAKCEYTQLIYDFEIVIVPLFSNDKDILRIKNHSQNIAVEVPRAMFGVENKIKNRLIEIKNLGIDHAVVHNIGAIQIARELNFTMHGGFGLNITNTSAVLWAEEMGLADVELSFELSLDHIRQIGGNIPFGITSYGRLPLMITRNCPNHSIGKTCADCNGKGYLIDRKGISFPFACDGVATQIFNSLPTLLAENLEHLSLVDFEIYSMTDFDEFQKNSQSRIELLRNTINSTKVTNGLYHRGFK